MTDKKTTINATILLTLFLGGCGLFLRIKLLREGK